MKPPTVMQRRVLAFFAAFHGDMGYYPTQREVCAFFGWSSANASRCHLEHLDRKKLTAKAGGAQQHRRFELSGHGWLEVLNLQQRPRVDIKPGHAVLQPAKCDCGNETYTLDGVCFVCAKEATAATKRRRAWRTGRRMANG